MPFIDIFSKHDFASMHYVTNTAFNNVSSFDPKKPSLLILHPFLLDSSWLNNQFEDGRLYQFYNIIAFDRRSSGKSRCKASGSHDSWVDAADLAFCHHALHLPPCHILALESVAVNCALRFALLFPEKCLSLILCNVPSSLEAKWVNAAYHEILRNWCFADDLETLEQAQFEVAKFVIGNDRDMDLQDELIAYWQMEIPPTRRHRVLETFNVLLHRDCLEDETLASIKHPVLIVHGEKNDVYPLKHAQQLSSQLQNAEGGAILYSVKGGGAGLALVQSSVSITNQVLAKFLARQPYVGSVLRAPEVARDDRMRTALMRLADIMSDSAITRRDPLSPISFSCLTQDIVQTQTDLLTQYRSRENQAFSPLGVDGRPIRRYSAKQHDHWFFGGKGGLSVANTVITADRTPIKFDPDREKMSSLRGDYADDKYARKHSAGEITITKVTSTSIMSNTPNIR
ncbi:hypothetical protein APHAL10511_002044 [Amanita phalloides]|nr:hypothetical protein APHAL10511_002044 [Amanita phalloides]